MVGVHSTCRVGVYDGWEVLRGLSVGYQTRFKLSFLGGDANTPTAVLSYLAKRDLIDEDFTFEADSDDRQELEFTNKWYEHDADMLLLSQKLPTVEFHLEGEGQSQGDVWESRFLGGRIKHWRPRVVWPTEDEIAAMPWDNRLPR